MVDGMNGQRRRSHDGVERLYPWFQSYMISRFRARSQNGSSRLNKLRDLSAAVFSRSNETRMSKHPVHSRVLQRWARQYANRVGLHNFTASINWLYNFKRRYGIVSRKETVHVSRSEVESADNIIASIRMLHEKYAQKSRIFGMDTIWNFDQTGFNYESSTTLRSLLISEL